MHRTKLELIQLLTSTYRKNTIDGINHIINGIDTPLCVRNFALQAVGVNEAALDLMRQTRLQFYAAKPIEIFSPDDINSGLAQQWLYKLHQTAQLGRGGFEARFWNGKEVLPGRTDLVTVGNWSVLGFTLASRPALRLVQNREGPRSPARPCKSKRSFLQLV